jgi:hypothetical protein
MGRDNHNPDRSEAPGVERKAVFKLMYAALIRAAERWCCLRFTEFELRRIAAIRKELNTEYGESGTFVGIAR